MAKNKVQRKHLSFEEQNTILKEIEKGKSKNDILKTYGISKTFLRTIIQNKENIIRLSKNEEFKIKKTKCSSENRILEECLFTWFSQARALGTPISGPIIQEKALQLNNLLEGPSDFKVSNEYIYITY